MRRSLVRIAIGLIAANAALAIVILLGGDMGETGGRILGTSLLATATALIVMVQLPALSDRRLGLVPLVAIAAAGIGFVIMTYGIWSEFGSEIGWKTAGTAYTIGVAGAMAVIVAGQPIAGPSRWVRNATLGIIGLGAAWLIAGMWFEIESEGYWRLFAVVAVLVAAGLLAVPILSRSEAADHVEMAVTHCPFCGTDVGSQRAADASCPACGNRFGVTLHAIELSSLSSKIAG
jgi:hypothetical protein